MTEAQFRNPWEQLEDEPCEWYACFQVNLDLGPFRSLTKANRLWTRRKVKPSKTASNRADEDHREERALAYDQAECTEKAALVQTRACGRPDGPPKPAPAGGRLAAQPADRPPRAFIVSPRETSWTYPRGCRSMTCRFNREHSAAARPRGQSQPEQGLEAANRPGAKAAIQRESTRS